MGIIRLEHGIKTRLGINVTTIVIIKHYTTRSLAATVDELPYSLPRDFYNTPNSELDDSEIEPEYELIVETRSHGTKMSLRPVHSGVGEVPVFVGVAYHMGING
ncbi:hypothetical protein F4806DRAFT_456360 [Annulohypoxylon nitens]|nr:hypothetical protein F4806DRAFT_456360 [Annulohypoxylon nitens]